MSNSTEDDSNTCFVCYKQAIYYSIGLCNHPVCYECSTRMRVLCKQTECPICRQDLPKVIFVKNVRLYKDLRDRGYDKKYKIGFENEEIAKAYWALLEHGCNVCYPYRIFPSFNLLKEHMRRAHELYYCDLCVDNLKIFTFEKRCYGRVELGQHRRKGDSDDRSHRGHPLCEFCDVRFMDNDALFRHLRRDHLFCHFCDADGYHRFFPTYYTLREHFKNEHYLCEEGDCKEEKLTAVFRSDIDLKAHRASVHAKSLGKAGTKQARTLELEFTLAPRPKASAPVQRRQMQDFDNFEGAVGYSVEPQQLPSLPDTMCPDNFPSLSGEVRHTVIGPRSVQYRGNNTRLAMSDENFPALHGGITPSNQQTFNISLQRGGGGSNQRSSNNLSIQVKHRPNRANGASLSSVLQNMHEFPTLGSPAVPPVATSWKGTVAPKNENDLAAKFTSSCSTTGVKPSVSVSVKPPGVANNKSPQSNLVSLKTAIDNAKAAAAASSLAQVEPEEVKAPTTTTTKSKKKKNKDNKGKQSTSQPNENRKCSELNIGELETGETSIRDAPPGLSPLNVVHTNLGPPPGFSVTLNSIARKSTPTTTPTNYESLPITQRAGTYIPPPNFENRNKILAESINKALSKIKDNGGIDRFRESSRNYRQGKINASEYSNYCMEAMGIDEFSKIFPELLALLPDIRKQQDLWDIHGRNGMLEDCKACGQVLCLSDIKEHYNHHVLESNFPALSQAKVKTPSWPKARR